VSYGVKPTEIRHPQAALFAEEYPCQRIQSLGYTADLNSEEVNQLTDPNVVEVVDSDPTVSLTIDTNEFGSINIYNQLSGFYGFPESITDVRDRYGFTEATIDNTNHRDGTISHTDFGEVATDFQVVIKDTAADTNQSRVLWFNNCFVDSVSGTYQVDGFASESISMTGAWQRWFLNGFAGTRIQKATYVSGSSLETTHTNAPIMLMEDGVELPSSYWTAGGAGFVSAGGYAFKAASRYRLADVGATLAFPSLGDAVTPIGGVKEGEIEILMWDSGRIGAEPGYGVDTIPGTVMLRLQSVDYEVSFDREDLKQLSTGVYYKGLNTTTVTASISAIESNLELWALGAGLATDFTTSALTSMSLSDFQNMSDIQIRVDVFSTKNLTEHSESTILKSIRLHDGKVTSTGNSSDVPGRGTATFDLQFKRANFVGYGQTGRGDTAQVVHDSK